MTSSYANRCNAAIRRHEVRSIKLGEWLFRWTPFTPIARLLIKRHQRFADLLSDVRWTEERVTSIGSGYECLYGFEGPEDADQTEEGGDTLTTADLAALPETPAQTMSFATDDDDYDIAIVLPASNRIDRLNAATWVIEQLERNLEKMAAKMDKAKMASKKTTKKGKK